MMAWRLVIYMRFTGSRTTGGAGLQEEKVRFMTSTPETTGFTWSLLVFYGLILGCATSGGRAGTYSNSGD